jgi:hypothetical protein
LNSDGACSRGLAAGSGGAAPVGDGGPEDSAGLGMADRPGLDDAVGAPLPEPGQGPLGPEVGGAADPGRVLPGVDVG